MFGLWYLLFIYSSEVFKHWDLFCASFALIKKVAVRRHFPFDLINFISSIRPIFSHNYGIFKFFSNLLIIILLEPVVNQSETIVYRQKLWDVIYYEIKAFLKNPCWCEKARPSFHRILKYSSLWLIKKSRISSNLF